VFLVCSMNATASHDLADHFAISFEEIRTKMAAERKRKGLAGALQAAILRLLDAIVALLAELRDGRLAAPAPACATRTEPSAEESCGSGPASGEWHRDYRMAVRTAPPAARGDAGADRGPASAGARSFTAVVPDAGSVGTTGDVVATTADAESTQTLIEPPSAFAAGGGCIQPAPHSPDLASPLILPLRRRVVRLTVSDSKIGLEDARG
jgi:hypothetical protein